MQKFQTDRRRLRGWMARLAVIVIALGYSAGAYAQSCAMCYNTAAAAKAGAIRALRSGILILLVPPILMFIAIFLAAYRNRNRFREEEPQQAALDREWSDWLASSPAAFPSERGSFEPERFDYR